MKLFPCPMCGAGSTNVYMEGASRGVTITHFCTSIDGVALEMRTIRASDEAAAELAYNRWGLPTQLAVVDAAWGTANNDVSVPSTDWAKRIIAKAREAIGRGDYDDINRYDP